MDNQQNSSTGSDIPQVTFKDLGRDATTSFYGLDQAPPDNIGKLNNFFTLWKNKRIKGRLPSRADFSFEEFAGWHAQMRVVDIGGDIDQLKTNLIIGEVFAKIFGRKTMHELIHSEISLSEDTVRHYDKYLEHLYNDGYCITVGTISNQDGIAQKFKWLDLPLSEDGKNISHLITAIMLDDD